MQKSVENFYVMSVRLWFCDSVKPLGAARCFGELGALGSDSGRGLVSRSCPLSGLADYSGLPPAAGY